MARSRTCPQCGAELHPDALEGLCPNCLGKVALESEGPAQRSEVRGQRSDGTPAEVGRDVSPSRRLSRAGGPIAPVSPIQHPVSSIEHPATRFGDYELLSEIAHGGMGVVFKARQVSLNRTVAVKMIRAGPFASKEFVHRFRVEASAAAVLQHPNIVAVHEVGVHEGQHFFSMDYVAGQNLAQIVREGPLLPNRAARYVQKIAEAIHYAHQSGILHRDLKPSNVLIDLNDQPRITDFGLAKRLVGTRSTASQTSGGQIGDEVELVPPESVTLTGEVMGTPGYMPPEQASGNRGAVKAWSDVYSLGAILYHLLTGRAPFAAGSLEETLNQVLNQDPISVRLLNPAVPRDLDTICLKCLEKEPTKRYGSAQVLAEELTRFLNYEPIQARPISAVGKTLRWCRRKPALATALATAVALLVIVAVGSPIAALRINHARQLAEAHRGMAEAQLYAAEMNLAAQAVREGSLGAAKAILERHRKETNFIGFEWRYLWQRCRGDYEFSLAGHQSHLCKIAFSPDGKLLASRDYEHTLKLWDLSTRQERLSLTNITGLAGFTPDGTGLILGTDGHAIVNCDVATGRLTRGYEDWGGPLELLADGRTLATTSTNFLVRYFDLPSGRETARLLGAGGIWWAFDQESCHVSLSGDGRYLVNCEDIWTPTNKVRFTVWDVHSQTRLATYEEQFTNRASMRARTRIEMLRMLPNSFTVTWAAPDNFVRFWQWTNRAAGLTVVPNRQIGVYALAASADGQWLVTGSSDESIKLWDRPSLREVALLRGHEARVTTLAYSPDDRWLASGSRDRTVKFWNLARPRAPNSLSGLLATVGFYRIAFTPGSTLAAIVMDNDTVTLLNVGTLQTVLSLTNSLTHIGFIEEGTKIVTVARDNPPTLEIWNVAAGNMVRRVPLVGFTNLSEMLIFELSPDGTRLAVSMNYQAVHLIDVESGRELARLPAAGRVVRSLRFTRDAERLMATDDAGRVLFWDLKQSELIRNIRGHSLVSFALDISPDGAVLATASRGQIRLWDATTGEPQGEFPAHRQSILGLAFSPDGKTLASASTDGTLKLWRLPALQEVCTIPFSERPGSNEDHRLARVAFAPDGNSLWASTMAGELKVWRAAPWKQIAQAEKEERRP